jgi:hypothetical protein
MLIHLTPAVVVIYLALSAVVGALGRNLRAGFWGFFVLSVLFTPVVTIALMAICMPKRADHRLR